MIQSILQDECQAQATRVRHEQHECGTSATRVRHERHQCDTSVARVLHERQSATRMKNFDFDNDKSENIFSRSYISCMADERLQEQEQLHFKNYLLKMSCSHANTQLKSTPQKLNFLMPKAISKSLTLDCSCKCPYIFPHSYAQ